MKLDFEQKEKVKQLLDEKTSEKVLCPVCGHKEWNLSDTIFEIREYHGGDFIAGKGSIVPVIVLTCTNCGNSLFFNAIPPEI